MPEKPTIIDTTLDENGTYVPVNGGVAPGHNGMPDKRKKARGQPPKVIKPPFLKAKKSLIRVTRVGPAKPSPATEGVNNFIEGIETGLKIFSKIERFLR